MNRLFELLSCCEVSCRKGNKGDENNAYTKNDTCFMGFDKFFDF